MSWIDWLIVIVPITLVVGLAWYAKRYARGVVDYLAAGRLAGRYVICVGDVVAGLSVITLVAGVERNYQTGYGVGFWNLILAPVGIVLALTGFCNYRWRQTRCLSKGQFIELRYGSKSFRIITAAISSIAEAVTNAIGPAIAANFFIYYLDLPRWIHIFGFSVPTYGVLVTICLVLALLIIWPAGRVSLLITDCCQGLLSYPIFVLIVGFIFLNFSWGMDIAPVMADRASGQSFIDPYDISQLRDFNLFALVVSLTSTIMNRASWIGNDTSNTGRTPHEQKMAGILGSWRNGMAYVMILVVAVMIISFMNSANFSGANTRFKTNNNEIRKVLSVKVMEQVVEDPVRRSEINAKVKDLPYKSHVVGVDKPLAQYDTLNRTTQSNLDAPYFDLVRRELGDTPQGRAQFQEYRTLYQQMIMPTVLHEIFPVGLTGIFCLLMVMMLISTDDTRIFNAAGCIFQDMILPFCKKHLAPERHIFLLRITTLGVTLFFFVVSIFFRQMDYINMFTTIMCAFWTGGAGPIMIFGLYTRFGNLTGAWCSLIFGSGTSLVGLCLQRNWAETVYPWIERHGWVGNVDAVLRTLSGPFEPYIFWRMDAVKFPINSYEIYFISMMLAISTYIIGSFLTYKPFDLDKLLHRGKYSDTPEVKPEPWSMRTIFSKLICITPEYSTGDKVIAWSVFIYTFVYQILISFVLVTVWNAIARWPKEWWNAYFLITSLIVPVIIGLISTVWFFWGGLVDGRRLFKDLAKRKEDPLDNGQVYKS